MTDADASQPKPEQPGDRQPPAEVTLHDAFGRPTKLPRAQWRKEVLPKMVDAYVHAPDRLAGMILQHVREGLAEDLVPAAIRLAAVDPEPERGLAVLATVQREAGDLDDSAATLDELLGKRPQSVAGRVCQAMLCDRRGDRQAGIDKLWEALQIDCNNPDALHGYLQWEHQRVGNDGYQAIVDKLCALPGSWRAQLWRARAAIERGDLAAAERDFRDVAGRAGEQSDALVMMGADLARTGQNDLFAELVLPRYQISAHHPHVGLAVLQHYLQTRQPEPGLQLLHELRVRFQRALDAQLAPFDAEFTRMTVPQPAPPPAGTQPQVVLYRVDRPLWYGLLGEPEYLVGKPQGAPRVLFAGLASTQVEAAMQVTKEDELGRLTRSIPLFLAEQLWYGTPVRSGVALPVADFGGWVVSGVPWAEDRLADLLTDRERQDTRIVTGAVRADGSKRRVDLWVYDCGQKQRVGHAAADGEAGQIGPMLLQLLAELSPLVGGPAGLKPEIGSPQWWDRYSAGQAQLAAFVVAKAGALQKERVFGHRAILEWLLAVALEERNYVPARLLLAAALCGDAALGSQVHKELAAPMAELFRVEPPQTPFAQTAFLPLKAMGLQHLWQHRREQILAAGTDAYRKWVQQAGG